MGEQKKRRGRDIPGEIVEEILVKLPVKSLLRFKAVSKVWRGTIESIYFVEKHTDYHKSLVETQARIMVLKRKARYNGRLALENLLVSDKGIVPVSLYPVKSFNQSRSFKISEPCDGLFCVYSENRILNLVNPVTTSSRELPDPTSTLSEGGYRFQNLLGIGRENTVSPRYKVVRLFECDKKRLKESTRCMVFALDSNTWRYVDSPCCRVVYSQPLMHLDGVMYCFQNNMERPCAIGQELSKILAFDLHTEKFQSFPISPVIRHRNWDGLCMRALNHRLCIFKRFVGDGDRIFKIWGLDINKRSWEIMYSIDLSCFSLNYEKWSSLIPVATINNYLIMTNYRKDIWVLDSSKSYILYHMKSPPNQSESCFVMSYFETLVSPY